MNLTRSADFRRRLDFVVEMMDPKTGVAYFMIFNDKPAIYWIDTVYFRLSITISATLELPTLSNGKRISGCLVDVRCLSKFPQTLNQC
jgi:hypothetical protein